MKDDERFFLLGGQAQACGYMNHSMAQRCVRLRVRFWWLTTSRCGFRYVFVVDMICLAESRSQALDPKGGGRSIPKRNTAILVLSDLWLIIPAMRGCGGIEHTIRSLICRLRTTTSKQLYCEELGGI
jgi:hypothetical protein